MLSKASSYSFFDFYDGKDTKNAVRFLLKLHFVIIIMWALIYSHNQNSDAFIMNHNSDS